MPRFLAHALVVAMVAACGSPGSTVSPRPIPTAVTRATPDPASSLSTWGPLLARGTFKLYGANVALDAIGSGESVTGTLTVDHGDGRFTADLECSQRTADGVLLIAGDITTSTSPHAKEGAREVIVLKPGSPVLASFDSEGRSGGDVRPAASCPELLDQVIKTGTQTVVGDNGLEPIEGTVEFAK